LVTLVTLATAVDLIVMFFLSLKFHCMTNNVKRLYQAFLGLSTTFLDLP
jgi:hypothetical protein